MPGTVDPSSGQLAAALMAQYPEEMLRARRMSGLSEQLGEASAAPLQGQMVSGHYVAPSWTQGLNQALQGYISGKLSNDAEKLQASVLSKREASRQEAIKNFMTAMGQGGQATKQAAFQAAMSNDPALSKLGTTYLTTAPKGWTPGEVHTDAFGNVVTPQAPDGSAGFALQNINGDMYQTSASGVRKVDNASKTNIRVNASPVVMGQRAGAMEYFKKAADQVDKLGAQANSSQGMLQTIQTLRQLDAAGINSNITSGIVTTAQNLGQALGVPVDTAKLGNTEAYGSLITDLWQRSVSQFGGNRGVTAEEAAEIKKLTPMAQHSPQARQQIFAIQEAAAKRNIQAYQQANQSFAAAAAADDPRLFHIPDAMEQVYTPPAASPSEKSGQTVRKYNPQTGKIE